MKFKWAVVGIAGALAFTISSLAVAAAEFRGVDFLSAQDNSSRVTALSPDGSTVVGSSEFVFNYPGFDPPVRWSDGRRPFHWTSSGMAPITGGISGSRWFDSPTAVSFGGNVVVGVQQGSSMFSPTGSTDTIYVPQPYVWTAGGGRQRIQSLTNQGYPIHPKALSHDGTVWVGESGNEINPGDRTEAFRYTLDGGAVGLGYLPGGDASPRPWPDGHSAATGVSADGAVVVGYSASANSLNQPWQGGPLQNDGYSGYEAFVWTEASGMFGLGDLTGGYFDSQANAVSADGQVVVGRGTSAQGGEAFRWTSTTGMVGLGFLNPHAAASSAMSASGDGSTIVGQSIIRRELMLNSKLGLVPIVHDHYAAFIWDATHGMRNLQRVLETDYGLDLAGWQLTSAVDISDDGLVIAGNGINPLGQEEGWMLRLEPIPEPATVLLFVLGICGVLVWRKQIHGSRQSCRPR